MQIGEGGLEGGGQLEKTAAATTSFAHRPQ